jgi:predicted kinase
VLDGSYRSRRERDRVCQVFEQRAKVAFVRCFCGEEVVKARLAKRAADPDAVSDGRWDIYLHQKEIFEYPDELPADQCRMIDTDQPVELLLDRLDRDLLSSPCFPLVA